MVQVIEKMKQFTLKLCRALGAGFYELGREDFSTSCPWDDKEEDDKEARTTRVTWHPPVERDWQGGHFGNPVVTFKEAHGYKCPTCNGSGMAHMGNPPCPSCGT